MATARPRLVLAVAAAAVAMVARPPTDIRLPGSHLPLTTPRFVPRLAPLPPSLRDVLAAQAAVVPGTETVTGCETPAVGADGTLFLPDDRGRVWRLPRGAREPALLATLPGRPLGAAVAADGHVIVACAAAGVFGVHPRTGAVRLLTAASDDDGAPILFADGVFPLDGDDGSFLVTDAMDAPPPPPARPGAPWRALEGSAAAMFSGAPSGRLLRHDGRTGRTTVLARDLWFPNGVVALAGGDAVVSETFSARLVRVAAATGDVTPFGPPLPGFPDGLALTPDGKHILVAIYGVSDPKGFTALASSPRLRSIVYRLPQRVIDAATPPIGLVLKVDAATGETVDAVADASGKVVAAVTAAVPDGAGGVLLGSLSAAGVKRVVF